MYRLKDYSYITRSSLDIVINWGVDKQINPGLLIACDKVYSICTGRVVQVDKDDSGYYVSIQYDYNTLFRYCFLKNVHVTAGERVVFGDIVGDCKDNNLMGSFKGNSFRFEYCTRDRSEFSVRFSRNTYYKHDPTDVVLDEAEYQYDPSLVAEISTDSSYNKDELSRSSEFRTNGR